MARRKKVKKEDDVGQDYRFDDWIRTPHHPACSCPTCNLNRKLYRQSQEPQHTELQVPNDLASVVAKAACDKSVRLQDFYLKLIERGLKTLDFDNL